MCESTAEPSSIPSSTPSQLPSVSPSGAPSDVTLTPSEQPSFTPNCDNRNVLDFRYRGVLSQSCDQLTDQSEFVDVCQNTPNFDLLNLPNDLASGFTFFKDNTQESLEVDVQSSFIQPETYRIEVPVGTEQIQVTWPLPFNSTIGGQTFIIELPQGDLSLLDDQFLGPLQIVSLFHPVRGFPMFQTFLTTQYPIIS